MDAATISHIWPVLTAIIGLVAWAVRLEARTLASERRIAQLELSSADVKTKLDVELVQIRERLVRIETLLTTPAHDLHKDARRQ